MRIFVIPPLFLVCIVAGSASVCAQAIHLKNGDVIHAEQVTEHANSVTYEVGDNSYTIPKSRVKSIESGAPAAQVANALELPALAPEISPKDDGHLLEKIVRDGNVDRAALAAIETSGNSKEIALAYYIAGRFEFQAGKLANARADFEIGMRNDPGNPALLNYYAALLVRSGSPLEAIDYAEKASDLVPDSPDAFAVLGYAQFAAGRPRDAIQSWKKSLALRLDASIQALLQRAEREVSAEKTFSQHQTGHFVLRYEGGQTSDNFREQLMETLEAHYSDLTREFESEPRSSIQVVLYTRQTFFDVTRAPSWTSALNDGRLRIPVDGLASVTPDLSRVLRHELAHSFVNQLTTGRCPHWLNEGIAQMVEPRQLGPKLTELAELFKQQRELPINQLEGGFTSLNMAEAVLVYDESLATVNYLRDAYGMPDIVRILQRIGDGDSAEAALRATIHTDYRQLESDVRAYLLRQTEN